MSTKRIGMDIDGVLYPWHTAVYNYLRIYNGCPPPSYRDLWLDPHKYMSEEKWAYIASLPILYSTIFPRKGVLDLLNTQDKAGHTIYYITNRESHLERVTRKYLADHKFPQLSNLILTKDKEQEVRILEIDIFVEDRPKNLEKLAGLCRTIGIIQPWNEAKQEYLESLGVLFIPYVECLNDVL